MNLPNQYKWLENEKAPKMLVEALSHYGTIEVPGKGNNPKILAWAKEVGGKVADVYLADEIPWCGLFMAVVAKRTNRPVVKDPLWALNWGTYGSKIDNPELGDVLVFVRTTSEGKKAGHVGLYVGEDADAYHVLGGNTSDAVSITRIAKSRLYAARRTNYNIKPSNVRKIVLSKTGKLSENEQ